MSPVAPSAEGTITFGTFQLNPNLQLLLDKGQPVHIGSRALQILIALVERSGLLVSKADLIKLVWPESIVEDGNLKVHVGALRRILGDGRDGKRYIVNIPRRGYMFVASVEYSRPVSLPAVVPELLYRLPSAPIDLVGRTETICTLAEQVTQSRLLTIAGPGGVGKTSVALAVVEGLKSCFPDGICFVDLAPVADPKLIPSTLATSLGVAVRSDYAVPALLAFLRGKTILIVLDSCEHVVDTAAALCRELLSALPQLRILTTSREPLRAAGERVIRLPSLSTPPETDALTSRDALAFSSVELFVTRASIQFEPYQLSDSDAPHVAEICRRLDGNALAIEMAVGRVDVFGVRGVASLLDDRFRFLRSSWRGALPRHHTLTIVLDWSYDLLSEAERLVLRRLGVFAGHFTLSAASQVAADELLTSSDVIAAIGDLVHKSLVSADVSGATPQYRLLDTTCAYARQKLQDEGEFASVAQRHATYCLERLVLTNRDPSRGASADRAAVYVGQVANVRVALDWTFSSGGDVATGVALTIASVPLWLSTSLIGECRKRVGRALECLLPNREDAARQQMQLLTALGVAMYSQGPSSEAQESWTKVLSLAESLGDDDHQLRALWGLWVVSVTGGSHREGFTIAENFACLAKHSSDALGLLVGGRLVGTSLHFLGRQREAKVHFDAVVSHRFSFKLNEQIVRFQFDQSVASYAFYGRILWIHGFPDQAMRAVEESVLQAQAQGHALSLCYALGQGACPVSLLAGDLDAAERNIALLIDNATKHMLPLWQSMGRCFKGMLLARRGEPLEGLRLLGESLDELRLAGFTLYHTAALIEFARCLGQAGRIGPALAAINQALTQARQHEEHWCAPEILRVKGELLLLQPAPNRDVEAERLFAESLELAQQQEALSWQLRAAMSLAHFNHNQQRPGQGLGALATVYAGFTEGFGTHDLSAAKRLLTQLTRPDSPAP